MDAERAVGETGPWQHLKERDGWNRPEGATDEQCQFMVQAMESWFLADRTALSAYYGQGFQENPLPSNPQIEQVAKMMYSRQFARQRAVLRKAATTKGGTALKFSRK